MPAAAFLLVALSPPLNHDVAAVLNFAERMLAGERLYADLIDVNPPLIFVLNLLPAAVGAWTPLDAVQGLLVCLLGFCALSRLAGAAAVPARRGAGRGGLPRRRAAAADPGGGL